ncbi:response regulator [candidate division KSB1 bacterium]|nr:response regulator [candidate division KSB1 bacterium]
MDTIKALLVDDEWLIRQELARMLENNRAIGLIREAASVEEAIDLLSDFKPDVIFLDVEMPGESGFTLFQKAKINCQVIFVTAYDQYAVRAFEVNALDYLLKPIRPERLHQSIDRLTCNTRMQEKEKQELTIDDVIYLNIDGALRFIKLYNIKYIYAEGNYSIIQLESGQKELVSKTLQEWQEILPENYFIRIHRSCIVNFNYVEHVEKCKNNTCHIYLKDSSDYHVMSRRYVSKLKKSLAT